MLGWIFILFLIIVLIVVVWIFLKTTIAGKAADAAIGRGLGVVNLNLDKITKTLIQTNQSDPSYHALQAQYTDLQDQKADFYIGFV